MVCNRYPEGSICALRYKPLTRQEATRLPCLVSEKERGKVIAEIRRGIERLRLGLPCGRLASLMEKALGPVRTEELLSLARRH